MNGEPIEQPALTKRARKPAPEPLELPRGFRNNNPGNLRKSTDAWQGLAKQQPDPEFFTFVSPVMGIRALATTLRTYFDRYGLDTVSAIVKRWAPPNENNTAAYIQAVANQMRRGPRDRLDLFEYADMMPLVQAIIRHELGNPAAFGRKEWYAQDIIDEGLRRMGVKPPQKSVAKDTQAVSTAAGAAGATATAAGGTIAYVELREAGRELREAGKASEALGVTLAGIAVTMAALAVLAYTIWRRRKRQKQ